MKKLILTIILAVFGLTGCTTLQTQTRGELQRSEQEKKLARAISLIQKGDTESATEVLESIADDRGIDGVTDEALFRLSILHLTPDADRESVLQALKPLERLRKEYPTSPWYAQASPLAEFLTNLSRKLQSATELRRQLKTLKDLNLSVTRENKELKLNIEKLKNLDVELERKKKP